MELPHEVVDAVERVAAARVRAAEPVGGGCIAHATRVRTDRSTYFVKWSRSPEVARTFTAEAEGLAVLLAAQGAGGSALLVPEPLVAAGAEGQRAGMLVLAWIEPGSPGPGFWERFGEGLAALHRHTDARYGFDRDNFIGRMPQVNTREDSWEVFFREHRLEAQARHVRRAGGWEPGWDRLLERLYARLAALLPAAPEASVLHGDLWSGNYLAARDDRAALVDPAVYYGHREADLAMTELFGGFDPRFYAAYRAAWPLDPGYEERREVYNLYHLLNHLNHFGGGYAGAVAATLRRFGG